MSIGYGLCKLAGGIAKRERDQWARLAAGWTCELPTCEEPGVALLRDWTGAGRPVCERHAERARELGRTTDYPPQEPADG